MRIWHTGPCIVIKKLYFAFEQIIRIITEYKNIKVSFKEEKYFFDICRKIRFHLVSPIYK